MNIKNNMDDIYRQIIRDLLYNPYRVSTTRKGFKVYEQFNYQFTLTDIFNSFVNVRNASWDYLEREFHFYADGSDSVEDASLLSKFWLGCTDDGKTINSNYGKLLLHDRNSKDKTQFQHAADCLLNNPYTKKAVMVLYNPEHAYISNDNPCTMYLNLFTAPCSEFISEDARRGAVLKLHMTAFMRSNDVWFGLPYDVPYFCSILYSMQRVLAEPMLKTHNVKLEIGSYTHHVSNLHVYERNKEELHTAMDCDAFQLPKEQMQELYDITLNAVQIHASGSFTYTEAINVAWAQASFSKCLKKKCGAVLCDKNNQIIGTGCGGREGTDCKTCARDNGEVFYSDGCYSVHAEMRAIISALRTYPDADFRKAIMYTTHGPCDACMKLMAYMGIGTCVYDVPYKTDYSHYPEVKVIEHRVRLGEHGKSAK